MVQQDHEIEDPRWIDGSYVHSSWDSGLSRDDTSEYLSRGSSTKTRHNQLKDSSNYWSSFHHPSKTYKREQIITSYKCLKQEEETLGRKILHIDNENEARNKVKRCKSDRCANTAERVPRKVKRTYSVIHRYDPAIEKVVTEYKCFEKQEQQPAKDDEDVPAPHIYRFQSEPQLVKEKQKPKKAKRSITTLLGMKLFNILSRKN